MSVFQQMNSAGTALDIVQGKEKIKSKAYILQGTYHLLGRQMNTLEKRKQIYYIRCLCSVAKLSDSLQPRGL